MKLDIEGCEALAISGARALLISGRVSIYTWITAHPVAVPLPTVAALKQLCVLDMNAFAER